MKKPPSEARHRKEVKQLTAERQEWATRAAVTGRALAKAEAEVAEWKARCDRAEARFDKLLSRETVPVAVGEDVKGLLEKWRGRARQADRWAAEHDAQFDGANSHAFLKERRIWTTCADELQELVLGVTEAMITVRELIDGASSPRKDGRWLPVLPMPCWAYLYRLKDAWEVWRGRAEAIRDGD